MVISDKLPRNQLCVDLITPYMRREDRSRFNILLTPFSLNPPDQKVYIMHNIAMAIANLADILCTTEYYHS